MGTTLNGYKMALGEEQTGQTPAMAYKINRLQMAVVATCGMYLPVLMMFYERIKCSHACLHLSRCMNRRSEAVFSPNSITTIGYGFVARSRRRLAIVSRANYANYWWRRSVVALA